MINDAHPAGARLGALAGLLVSLGCAPASTAAGATFDAQACVEDALRRSTAPELMRGTSSQFSSWCGAGDSGSCSALGVMYELGLDVPRDGGRAAILYRRACEAGYSRACANLGQLMLRRGAPAHGPDGALALLRAACEAGQGRACTALGRTFAEGVLVPRAPEMSALLFETACQRGDAAGCLALATLIERGVAVGPARRVGDLLIQACARGDAEGCERLAQRERATRPRAVVAGAGDRRGEIQRPPSQGSAQGADR